MGLIIKSIGNYSSFISILLNVVPQEDYNFITAKLKLNAYLRLYCPMQMVYWSMLYPMTHKLCCLQQ